MNIIKLEDIFKAKQISVNPNASPLHPLFFWLQTSGVVIEPKIHNQLFKLNIHLYHPPKYNHLIRLK